jgi:hypothetical protein
MLVEALGVSGEEAVTLFNSRFRFYSDMLKEHKSINDMLEPLADFVVIAGQENKPFKGNNPPLSLSMDRIHVLLSLNVWCSAHLETLFGTLDKYLSDKK